MIYELLKYFTSKELESGSTTGNYDTKFVQTDEISNLQNTKVIWAFLVLNLLKLIQKFLLFISLSLKKLLIYNKHICAVQINTSIILTSKGGHKPLAAKDGNTPFTITGRNAP